MTQVLVVDDEVGVRDFFSEILVNEGYIVKTAENADMARKVRMFSRPDLVLLDIWMADMDGMSLLKEWAVNGQLTMPVVMMSNHVSLESIEEATRIGAVTLIEKPIPPQKLILLVKNILQTHKVNKKVALSLDVFSSVKMLSLLKERLIRAVQATNLVVLHTQTTNVLTEICAQSFHKEGKVWIDGLSCLGRSSRNILADATEGTLFVTNFCMLEKAAKEHFFSLLPEAQAKKVKIFLGLPLSPISPEDTLRLQKFFLAWVKLPLLSDHREDISDLCVLLLQQMIDRNDCSFRFFSNMALSALSSYTWPGDFSELVDVVRNLAAISPNEEISAQDVGYSLRYATEVVNMPSLPINLSQPLREAREEFERMYFCHHIKIIGGNMTRLAETCGLERTHLYRKLRQLGMTPGRRAEQRMSSNRIEETVMT